MYIPSASLHRLGKAVRGGRRTASSPKHEAAKAVKKTKSKSSTDDHSIAESLAQLTFQVNGVLQAVTFLKTGS